MLWRPSARPSATLGGRRISGAPWPRSCRRSSRGSRGNRGDLRGPPAPLKAASMATRIDELEARREAAKGGGGEKRIAAQHAKGRLTARERLSVLLDVDSFEEYDMFVEHNCADFGMESQKVPGAGGPAGSGSGPGRLAYVFAQDF